MIELPKQITKSSVLSPRRMIIFSQPKVGKTTALSFLQNALFIDLEEGTKYVDVMSLNIKDILRKNPKSNILEVLTNISKQLTDYYIANNKWQYDYLIIDTTTALESFAKPYANFLYKQTPMGKSYTGSNVINDLANGAGYGYLRAAFENLLELLTDKCNICTILVAHTKNTAINKLGKDLQAQDLDLTGKLKNIIAADADGIGYMYRNSEGQTILSFKNHEQDLASGSRLDHLSQREFVLLEVINKDYATTGERKQFKHGWDKIFIQ